MLSRTRTNALLPIGVVLLLGSLAIAPFLPGSAPRAAAVEPGFVTAVTPANSPVTVSLTISPSQVSEGQSINLQASASGGTPPYSYSYSGLPNGCQGQSGQSFSCNPSESGSFSVQTTATDSHGNQSSPSNSVSVDVTQSTSGNGNGNNNGNGSNSSNPLSSLFSGFSGVLSLLLIFGLVGFVTWILLIVGVWIIAITLVRRLPKRGEWGTAGGTTKCAACSAAIPAGSKFCSACGASTAPKAP
jgi:hypothetical protein